MEEQVLITIMAMLIVLASFVSIFLSKLKLPPLVGFLAAGIIIANYIEPPAGAEDVVSTFSNLGLIMLMFSIGMEIDLSKLKVQGKFAAGIAIVQIPVMLFTGIIAGSSMGMDSVQSITFGAILSGASTAVVLAVLKSNNVLEREQMDILVLVMVIEDICQVIMMSILTPMMKGESMNTDALIVLILNIAIFMILCFTIGLKIVPRVLNWIYDRTDKELIPLLCIGLLFVLALLANMVGLSVAIGAFLAGVMVGMSRPKNDVEHFVEPLKTLFMAMFFISVGMEVSVASLADNIGTIAIVYVLFVTFMFIAVNIGYWVASGNSRNGWVSALAMCTMGEFAFIISKLALDYNVFDQSLYSSIVGAAIVSMVLLPILVKTSDKTYNAALRICPGFIKRILNRLTIERNLFIEGMSVTSQRTKERFQKGLTNAAFVLILIIFIEVAFFLIYTPLSQWLTANIGSDEQTWRIVILAVNIIVLLNPCIRLAKFMSFTIYIINKGREELNNREDLGSDAPKIYEYFSTLIIGAIITVIIVILVPNGLGVLVHILLLLIIVFLTILSHVWAYRNKKGETESTGTAVPAASEQTAEPDQTTESEEERQDDGTS